MTATPNRTDGIGLNKVFEQVVFEKNILSLMQEGYLCELRCRQIRAEIDVTHAATRFGDYASEKLTPLINTENVNELIISSWLEYAPDRFTLIFACDVDHAKQLASMFRAFGIKAEAVYYQMPLDERRAILSDFARGTIQVVINYGILGEGYDSPRTDCVLIARPTKSNLLYCQMVGRGTRIHPEKDDCLILDVACISHKRDLISVPDLFGLENLPDADETLTEAVERESRAKRQRPTVGWGGKTVAQEVDPFVASQLTWIKTSRGYLLNLGTPGKIAIYTAFEDVTRFHVYHQHDDGYDRLTDTPIDMSWAFSIAESHARRVTDGNLTIVDKDATWRNHPATEKQLTILRKKGIPYKYGITKGQASDIISTAFGR